jgi:hypothetical protein
MQLHPRKQIGAKLYFLNIGQAPVNIGQIGTIIRFDFRMGSQLCNRRLQDSVVEYVMAQLVFGDTLAF